MAKPSDQPKQPDKNSHKPVKKVGAWETESSFDQSATLEELIELPPFHQSSDDSGDSFTLAARVPNWMRRRIQKIIEMPNVPYELTSDVARDAMYLGLRILHMRYKATTDWNVQTKIAAVVDKATAGQRARQAFTKFQDGLSELVEEKDLQQASDYLTDYIANVSELEDEWLKKRTLGYIKTSKIVHEVAKYCSVEVQNSINAPLDESIEDSSKSGKG